MTVLLLNLLPIALLALLFWKATPIRPFSSELNGDYLSKKSCNALRGFFALVVIFHHLQHRTTCAEFFHFFAKDGFLPVAIFFFLSGYGLQKQHMTRPDYAKGFLLKRLPTVLFPYITATVLYWLMDLVLREPASLKEILISLVNGAPFVSFSWYVISILVFYVVFYLLMRLCGRNTPLLLTGVAIWYVANILFCVLMSYPTWWYNASHILILGMVWAIWEQKLLSFLRRWFWPVAAVVWVGFLVMFVFSGNITARFPYAWVSVAVAACSALLMTLSVLLFTLKFKVGNPILNYLGTVSLEMYLVQGIFMKCLHHDGFIRIQLDLIYSLLCIFGTVLLSSGLHLLHEYILRRYKRLLK